MRYGYGPVGDYNVCSQGNAYQTTWDMSPTNYEQSIPNFQNAANVPRFANGNPIDETQLMQYGSMITQVCTAAVHQLPFAIPAVMHSAQRP